MGLCHRERNSPIFTVDKIIVLSLTYSLLYPVDGAPAFGLAPCDEIYIHTKCFERFQDLEWAHLAPGGPV